MNPLLIFDYVYYQIGYLYKNAFNRKESFEFSSILILSLFQFINAITVINITIPLDKITDEPIIFFILGYLLFLSLNLIRYKKIVTYFDLSKKWENEAKKRRVVKIIFVITYIIFSFYILPTKYLR